ncbi:MAG: protein tyrosine phosphatase family protein [Thermosynechococcaceae cyanobacterium]
MISSLSDIEAFLPISATIATSGQPTGPQFSAIQAAGYRLIINLATPASSNWNPDEAAIAQALGMDYIGIPVDWEHPILSDFETLADCLDANGDRKVWVHCAKNMRVSALMYLYHRLRKGYSDETARRYLESIWQPNKIWQDFIDATLELYQD